MSIPADILSNLSARISDRKANRQRQKLVDRIGELTYAQRTDTAISYETEIATLVEEIRHLERTEELRHRKNIADPDSQRVTDHRPTASTPSRVARRARR